MSAHDNDTRLMLNINTLIRDIVPRQILNIKCKALSPCEPELPQFSYHKSFLFIIIFHSMQWVERCPVGRGLQSANASRTCGFISGF